MSTSTVELPSGVVTFVFTDIEASTRLLYRLGDGYVAVLERHRELLRDVWAEHRGREVSVEADSFFVAFADARDAVAACLSAQRALATEDWPGGVDVRVRIGLQTGLASPHGEDYVALAVHQAARVMASGHGGQILVTEDTVAAMGGDHEFELHPLGRFRLRDFTQPVRLYQLHGEGLGTDFPAVRAIPADAHNIVRAPTPMVGRDAVIEALTDQIAVGRALTLIGPGGVGKSRLAAEIGVALAPRWEDGVWFVELAGVTDAELVPTAIAEAIGVAERPGVARWDDVLARLEAQHAVVILDNCEHVATTCSRLIDSLLSRCAGLAVIATSREPLRTAGEILSPVEPLEFPTAAHPTADEVLASPAGRLFWERGSAVRPGFVVDDGNAAAVAGICRHTDGLPLLIELAAAHLSAQSPAEILTGLQDQLRFLRSPDPRTAARHRTVEGLLEWSHRLLTHDEQIAFRRLAVFGSSFTQWTAQSAVADQRISKGDVPQLVWSLVDRSLVTADLGSNDTRYRLLETVRSYGRKLLDDHGERVEVAARLGGALLDRLGPWFPADRRWIREVGEELDNLRHLVSQLGADHQDIAQQLACSIGRYHDASQSFRDGIAEVSRFAAVLDEPSSARVPLLTTLADLHLRTGDVEAAGDLVEAAAELAVGFGAPEWDDVAIDRTRGEIARRRGDLNGAVEIARAALDRTLSDRGRSRVYNLLGTTSAALGDFDTAARACQEELELNQALGYEGYIASAHGNLAEIALRVGDMAGAARHQRSCLDLAVSLGSTAMVAFSLIVAARVGAWQEDWTTAATLHFKAEELLEQTGLVVYEDDRREIEALLETLTLELGDEGVSDAKSAGEAMDVPQTVRLANQVLERAARADSARVGLAEGDKESS
jgi:predicted ATPase/class 3 adenylate cyclase